MGSDTDGNESRTNSFLGYRLVCFQGDGERIQVHREAGLGGPENKIIKFKVLIKALNDKRTWSNEIRVRMKRVKGR